MPSDIEIPFSKLPAPVRKYVYLFQGHQFLDRFAMGVMVAVTALALQGRGLGIGEIGSLFAIYAAVTLTAEQFKQLMQNQGAKGQQEQSRTIHGGPKTVWFTDVEGDVQTPEICVFSISNSCKFNNSGCIRLHAKCPLQWQFKVKDKWYNFRDFHSKELEEAFQDPANAEVTLSAINSNTSNDAIRAMIKILGTESWKADFESMAIEKLDKMEKFDIRRLSTFSSVRTKNKMATVFEWYFKDEYDAWIKYGKPNSASKTDHIPNVTCKDIEEKFELDKASSISFRLAM